MLWHTEVSCNWKKDSLKFKLEGDTGSIFNDRSHEYLDVY